MRAAIISDLQMDNPKADRSLPLIGEADVLLVAGDFHPNLARSLMSLAPYAKQLPVIYVPGNRDFYASKLETIISDCMELAQELGVTLLEDNSVVLDGVRFAGCTLWTDFNINGNVRAAQLAAARGINDFKQIRWADGTLFSPDDASTRHHYSRKFLEETIVSSAEPLVVITHHAPSRQSISPQFAGDVFNGAFASDLEYMMTGPKAPALWVHGATHHPVDYAVGVTRVLSNPRGYPGEVADFRADLVVDIPTLALERSI